MAAAMAEIRELTRIPTSSATPVQTLVCSITSANPWKNPNSRSLGVGVDAPEDDRVGRRGAVSAAAPPKAPNWRSPARNTQAVATNAAVSVGTCSELTKL